MTAREEIRDGLVWLLALPTQILTDATPVLLGVETGDSFCRIENRRISIDQSEVAISLYSGQEYSGGIPDVFLNANDRLNPLALPDAPGIAHLGVTATPDPAKTIRRIDFVASNKNPVNDSIDNEYDVIYLNKNTKYLLEVKKTAGMDGIVSGSFTFVNETPIT
tara:strand:+ start:3254 stop:3745 length:492 start_codon:yes stop_codon:yes gene_type:complete